MKNLFLLLLLPTFIYSQNSKGYFDVSKDAFYYEKMTEWKAGVFKDYDAKFETLLDDENYFVFRADDSYFEETIVLSLNERRKIVKIETFLKVYNGELSEWFPYKYPVKITTLFDVLGDPVESESNMLYKNKNDIGVKEGVFEKYYKWNNAIIKDTHVVLEVANLNLLDTIRNKRGKIKKIHKQKTGYVSYTAKGEGGITEKELKIHKNFMFADGVKKAARRNFDEIKSLIGNEKYKELVPLFEEESSLLSMMFYIKNENDPHEYFTTFYFLANAYYDINFKGQSKKENIKFTYTQLPDGVIAKAVGMNKDCCIEIQIDLEKWNDSSYFDKLFIMFHEFGHDIFNLNHSDGIRLMATNKIEFKDVSVFGEMLHEMLFEILKKQK